METTLIFEFDSKEDGIEYYKGVVYDSDLEESDEETYFYDGYRFYLTEQEILNRYGKPIICIGGGWTRSDIYYDKKNDCFIEQCYHEEYLDTDTVCDGCSIISDAYLWDKLVRCCNEEGMRVYLKYREHIPDPFRIGATITMDEFYEGVKVLRQEKPRHSFYCRQFGSIIIICNEEHGINTILGKTENYCFFYDQWCGVMGFHTWEEALACALEKITFHYNSIVERDEACKQKTSVITGPSSELVDSQPKKRWLERFKRRSNPD